MGTVVRGLTAPDFKLFEDAHVQTIKQFAADDNPATVGIVVDASSMRTRQPEVVTAVLAFVRSSNPEDQTFVVNFNDRLSWDCRLLAPKPEGRKALYDAVIGN